MYLCGHRYYDPQAGRWLNRDPIGISGGINIYGYCGNGPVGWADPSGLFELGGWIDKHLLGGAVAKLGADMGNPCTSGWQIAMDAGNLGLQAGMLVGGMLDGEGEAEVGAAVVEDVVEEVGANVAKNGETAATKLGRQIHNDWDYGEGFEKEVRLPSGRRPDAINRITGEVNELKPDNPRAIRQGEQQLQGYIDELNETDPRDGGWTGSVIRY